MFSELSANDARTVACPCPKLGHDAACLSVHATASSRSQDDATPRGRRHPCKDAIDEAKRAGVSGLASSVTFKKQHRTESFATQRTLNEPGQ